MTATIVTATIAEDWTEILDLFGSHLVRSGRKPSTIKGYRSHLRSLADLVEEGPDLVLPADIDLWLETSGGSTRLRRTIGHTFFTWAVDQGLLACSPAPRPVGAMPGRPGPQSRLMAELNRSEAGRRWHAWTMAFGDWQRAAGQSPGTIRAYRYRLWDLAMVAGCGPEGVTSRLLLHHLGNPRWGQATRKGARSAYRSFFSWAVKTERIEVSPADDLPSVRVPKRLPHPTPETVLHSALRTADEREEFMLRLGAIGGLRCMEIALVHASDWDGHRTLRVMGKGRKLRLVPIADPRLIELLNAVDGYAFSNRWTGRPLTPGHVSVLLSRALEQTWTGHSLRHRMATQGVRATGDLLSVGRVLGHESLNTTQMYTLLDDDRAMAVAEAVATAVALPDYSSRLDQARVGG